MTFIKPSEVRKAMPMPLYIEILAYAADPSVIERDVREEVYKKIFTGLVQELSEFPSLPQPDIQQLPTSDSYAQKVSTLFRSYFYACATKMRVQREDLEHAFLQTLKERTSPPLSLVSIPRSLISRNDRYLTEFVALGVLKKAFTPLMEPRDQGAHLRKLLVVTQAVKQITVLDLSHSLFGKTLPGVPKEIGMFRSLTKLSLRGHGLTGLPEEITALKSLTKLDVAQNKLTHLPETFPTLWSLETLQIEQNAFSDCPVVLRYLSNLSVLDVDLRLVHKYDDFFREIVETKKCLLNPWV